MNREEIFEIWSPRDGIWSPWAKPVLFANISTFASLAASDPVDITGIPNVDGATALVLDLPGALGVKIGLAAAAKGFRPIPLYNALPSPTGSAHGSSNAIVDVQSIMQTISVMTADLEKLKLANDAPPAFLLDANRRTGTGVKPAPGIFDNRSICLSTDFPSASRILASGIRRVVLLQEHPMPPQEDLAHTLVRWQEAGIQIHAAPTDQIGAPTQIQVRTPSMYRRLWQRVLATIGLRRNPLGGFGGALPIPSSSG